MGFIFQDHGLLPKLSVWENITYPLIPRGVSWAERSLRWGTVFGVLLLPTLATLAVTLLAPRRKVAIPETAND